MEVSARLRGFASRRSFIPGALAAACFVLAIVQLPGRIFADSRVELSLDPSLFLSRVGSVWNATGDLGNVSSAQFIGYLFPMGPWYAGARALGVPMWLVERLWLGALMAAAAIGMVKLLDALYDERRGIAHAVAGALFAFNPFVAVFIGRSSVALLAYVTLPWLLFCVARGATDDARWRWPAVFALVLAAAGGGVNVAYLPWTMLAAVALSAYQLLIRHTDWRRAWAFWWRAGLCSLATNLWWLVPVALQSRYGADFLAFLEQPLAIWATNSMSESLRLLGYWIVYAGTGFTGTAEPTVSVAPTFLFDGIVIVATFAVPAFAMAGLWLARRWRYAPFFGLLAFGSLLVMTAGFPLEKPLARALVSLYYDTPSLQFLRTTYKAAPGLALAVAVLAGTGAASLSGWLWDRRAAGVPWTPNPRFLLPVLIAVPVLAAFPIFRGSAVDARLAYVVPGSVKTALREADRASAPNTRLMTVPGQLFSWFDWGNTVSPPLPALTKRPVLTRSVVRWAPAASSQLQATVDDQLQQGRMVPGQLLPLLRLMGVGALLVATDGRRGQTDETDPATLATQLDRALAQLQPDRVDGTGRLFLPAPGLGGRARVLPQIRRYRIGPAGSDAGIVRAHPQRGSIVLDGDAEGISALAAAGRLDTRRALWYSGDLGEGALATEVRRGATLVFTDSNRRRSLLGSRIQANLGPTVGPADPLPRDLPRVKLFGDDPARQTVSVVPGLAYLRAPISPALSLDPEVRPAAAFDGDLRTAWISGAQDPSDRYLELAFRQPRPISRIRVAGHSDSLGRTTTLGVSVNGERERSVELKPGWTSIPIGRTVRTLRLAPKRVVGAFIVGRGGLDEVSIPGFSGRELLRLPTALASEARGLDLRHSAVAVELQRTTADLPYQAGSDAQDLQTENRTDRVDAERDLRRVVTLPAARSFALAGWGEANPFGPDAPFDRLAGVPSAWTMLSSSRFEGLPIRRASSAFDGSAATAWAGNLTRGQPAWIQITAPRPFRVSRFQLVRAASGYGFPTVVRVVTDGRRGQVALVSPAGFVRVAAPARTRTLRIDVLRSAPPRGAGLARFLRAVAIAEVRVPGLRPPAPRRFGPYATPCGAVVVRSGGSSGALLAAGRLQDLDLGQAQRLRGCGAGARLPLRAGSQSVIAAGTNSILPNHLDLFSAAQVPLPPPPQPQVGDPGTFSFASVNGAAVSSTRPFWLVLGESYSPGWRASCETLNGTKELGAPVPIDGYANGWQAPADCGSASFSFSISMTGITGPLFIKVGMLGICVVLAPRA